MTCFSSARVLCAETADAATTRKLQTLLLNPRARKFEYPRNDHIGHYVPLPEDRKSVPTAQRELVTHAAPDVPA